MSNTKTRYAVCVDKDTGSLHLVESKTAYNNLFGWHILHDGLNKEEAEKSLNWWKNRPSRLQDELARFLSF